MFDISKTKAFVCDLDGTLFMGPNPIEPAVDFVIRNTKSGRFRYYYLTNNTSKCPEEYMRKIAGAGSVAKGGDGCPRPVGFSARGSASPSP